MSRRLFAALLCLLTCLALPVSSWGDVKVRVTRASAITSVGTQDITLAGFGTPKAALAFLVGGITNGTAVVHGLLAVGATDCTNQWAATINDRDGATTGQANRRATATHFLQMMITTGTPKDGEGTVTCIANGVRINWTDALSAAYLVHVVLFGGSDLSAAAGVFTGHSSVGGTASVSGLAFAPQDVFMAGIGVEPFDDTGLTDAVLSLGIANATAQGSGAYFVDNGPETTAYIAGAHSAYVASGIFMNDYPATALELTAWAADGFTGTTRAATSARDYGYLALGYNGRVRSWNGQVTSPTNPGAFAITGPGWMPQFALGVLGAVAPGNVAAGDVDTFEDDQHAGVWGATIMDASAQYCWALRGEDGAVTTATGSLSQNTAVRLLTHTGTDLYTASFTRFSNTGMDLNFTVVPAQAAAWRFWAIEQFAPGGGIPLWAH